MRGERGSALVAAILVVFVMMLFGLAALTLGDGQSQAGAKERRAESNFNLSDGVLKTQVNLLAQNWPATLAGAYPSSCTPSSSSTLCPDSSTLSAQFTAADFSSGLTWTTQVQDDGGSVANSYSTAGAASQPSWDANGNHKVWLRATATIHGQTRVLIAQVQQTLTTLPFPRNTVTSGSFATNNNGNKVIVQTQGANGQSPGAVAVRCNQAAQSTCLNYPPSKGQVSPPVTQTSYPGTSALSPSQIQSLRSVAAANGTDYAGCPASLTGAVVFVESGNCSYGGNGVANSASNPGVLVINNGTLSLGGHYSYYGVIYALNAQQSTGYVVSTSGSSQIVGAVAVDGSGGVLAGASGTNITFNPNAFNGVVGYSGAGVVPGSWHELAPGQ